MLNDIRLLAKQEKGCSPATLLIHRDHYACDYQSENYGSIFNKAMDETMTMANLLLHTNSRSVLPEMIRLTVNPDGIYEGVAIYFQGRQLF